jgi:crotonobetainyl-CoA:carnitine CoA-transferase CaiB-like acyl-CoA transferase
MNKGEKYPNNNVMPLEGIRVVEYGVFHAGPGAGAILGDLGAEVIKIEEGRGDPERYWTKVVDVDFTMPDGESFMFQISNRNKKGIALDIKKLRGRQVFNRLLESSDVFITNLRKSTKFRLGIDYATISKTNPRIIYANVSGYGPNGPESDLGAFDPMGQARSGMMFIASDKEPVLLNLAVLDQTTAIAISHAILTALLYRERHGVGQEIDVSLFSTALWFQYVNMMMYGCMSIKQIASNRLKSSPLRNAFRCKDNKWIVGAHHDERYWALFCKATGQSRLLNDPRFSDDESRRTNNKELIELCDKVFATKTRDEWMDIFRAKGLMFCPVQKVQEVFTDSQAIENEYVVDFDHPALGKVKIPGYPVHFSSASAGTRSAAPALGEHTDIIMRQIGFTDKEIQDLKNEGVIWNKK